MSPKEKAEILVAKFIKHSRAEKDIKPIQSAKECALIAVDEIIETTFMNATYIAWGFKAIQKISTTDYWQEVKQEIEKL
jgi:hypothetical protein